jgi:hypothetical protein
MTERFDDIEERLMAYHMGWLNRHAMAELDQLLARSPEVAERSAAIQRCISPLEDWQTLPVDDQLQSQILARVRREDDRSIPITDAIRFEPVPPLPQAGVIPFTLREALVGVACLAMMVAVGIPAWARVAAESRKARCADNLRSISVALGGYRSDNGERLPFSGSPVVEGSPHANWLRERTPGVPRFRNSRNRFMLAAHDYLGDMATFLCPSDDRGLAMRVDDLKKFDDFAESRNCSYDSQLLLGVEPLHDNPELVIYADPNPIFTAQSQDATRFSPAHAALAGQNVMHLDGAVAWATSPHVGVRNDDIWRIGRRLNYTGSEFPRYATDSFMIP